MGVEKLTVATMCATYTLINKGVVVASIVKECLNSKRIFTIHPPPFLGGEFSPLPTPACFH